MTQKLFLENAYDKSTDAIVTAVDGCRVQLDKTVFYAASGGQPGDKGVIVASNQNISVIDTVKGEAPGDVWHVLPEDVSLHPGDAVKCEIDWDTRHKHMRMHTCLHLLCALVKGDVTGGAVGADKGRLDFNIASDAVDKDALENDLNRLISENHPVSFEWIADAELAANPGLIRTMSVKPPSGGGRVRLVRIGTLENTIDLQPCGGTHVKDG